MNDGPSAIQIEGNGIVAGNVLGIPNEDYYSTQTGFEYEIKRRINFRWTACVSR